jgi:hypothetical protein
MSSIHSNIKLKIKCPECNENLYGYSFWDDFLEEEHFTYCKKCCFRETHDETIERIKPKINK